MTPAKEIEMKTKATINEIKLLVNIAENNYTPLNGAEPDDRHDTACWNNTIEEGPNDLTGKTISGLMGSCTKKGFVETNGESVRFG